MSRIISGAIGTVLLLSQSFVYSFLLTGTTIGQLVFEAYRARYNIEADPAPQKFWLDLWRWDFLKYMAHPAWIYLPIGFLLLMYVIAGWFLRSGNGKARRHTFFKKYYDLSILLLVCLVSAVTHTSPSEKALNTGFLLLVFLAVPYLIIRTFNRYTGKGAFSLMSMVPFGLSFVLVLFAASATPLSYGYHQLKIEIRPVASLPIRNREWMDVILTSSFDRPGLIDFDEAALKIRFLERKYAIGAPREGETFDLGELATSDYSPCQAIEEGRLEILFVWLYKDLQKSVTCGTDSLLAAALDKREYPMVLALLGFGYEPEIEEVSKALETEDRDTALRIIAAFGGSDPEHETIVERLRPLIHEAKWVQARDVMQTIPGRVPTPNPGSSSIVSGHSLLDHHPKPKLPSEADFLEAARKARHGKIAEWLGHFCDRPETLRRAMLLAVSEADPWDDDKVKNCLSLINSEYADLDVADESGNTLLILAARQGLLLTLEYLLDNYADVGTINQDGENALMAAAVNGHLAVVDRLLAHHPELELLEDQNGDTVLIHAARAGHGDIVRLLLASNSDPTHRNLAGVDAKSAAGDPKIRKAVWDSMSFLQRGISSGMGHLFIFYTKADGSRFSLNVRQLLPRTSQPVESSLASNLNSREFTAIGCNSKEMTILYRKEGHNKVWWLQTDHRHWLNRGRIEGVELHGGTMIKGFCDSDSQMRVFYAGKSGHIHTMAKAYLEEWPHRSQQNLRLPTHETPLAVGWSASNWHLFYRDKKRKLQAMSGGHSSTIPADDLPDMMMSAAVLHSNWNKLDIFYLDDAKILSWRHWNGQRWDGPYSLPDTGRIDSKPSATAWGGDNRAVFFLRRYRASLHLFGSIWNGAAYEPPEDLGELDAVEIAAVSFSKR